MLKQDFRCLFQTRTLSEESCWTSLDAGGRLGIDQQGFLNVFLERRRWGRTCAVCSRPGLCLWRADEGAKTLEDDITLPTRILESGGLMVKPYIWKANSEDNQDSTIKDSS
ncbi:unnamed protein product [Gadus morhua 'NCC']